MKSRPALGPAQNHNQRVFPAVSCRSLQLTTLPYLVLRFITKGNIPLLLHIPSWHGQGKFLPYMEAKISIPCHRQPNT